MLMNITTCTLGSVVSELGWVRRDIQSAARTRMHLNMRGTSYPKNIIAVAREDLVLMVRMCLSE
uniref:Uncharacterized protein n=1 Tax=Arundo donax TaxID=35708 RepID=A0A0A9C4V3_ARUDO